MKSYINTLKKYAVFNGRASRREYWMFVLFNIIVGAVLGFADGLIGISGDSGTSIFVTIYQYAIFIPSIAVGIRRMHDVNKSGWFLLIPIYSLILTLTAGTAGDNKYGADPRVSA